MKISFVNISKVNRQCLHSLGTHSEDDLEKVSTTIVYLKPVEQFYGAKVHVMVQTLIRAHKCEIKYYLTCWVGPIDRPFCRRSKRSHLPTASDYIESSWPSPSTFLCFLKSQHSFSPVGHLLSMIRELINHGRGNYKITFGKHSETITILLGRAQRAEIRKGAIRDLISFK